MREGKPVGRIAAIVNRAHNRYYNDKVGFFGFFDSIDDPKVARALYDAATTELKQRGLDTIRGPYSPSVNGECGMLVEGFETAPFVLMPYNPPYYLKLVESLGLNPLRDLYAYYMSSSLGAPKRVQRIIDRTRKSSGFVLRTIDLKNLDRDLKIIHELYNETLNRNFGFLPLEMADLEQFAKEFKAIANPDMVVIAEKNGVPAGFSLALPNINEFLWESRHSKPWVRILKFIWALKTRHPKESRLIILGVRREFRNTGVGALFYAESLFRAKSKYVGREMSWVEAGNHEVIKGITLMGGKQYKTYRIYEQSLAN